jgi:hypothetical protein
MTGTTSPVANSQSAVASAERPLLPPEERFWQRYSPHNEFPLSGVGSVTIYVLLAVAIIAGIKFHLFDADHSPLTVGAVEFDPSLVGGGGGDTQGVKGGTGDQTPDKVGDVTKLTDPSLTPLPPLNPPKEIDEEKLPDIAKPEKVEDGTVPVYTEAMARLAGVEKATSEKLFENLRDKGQGGTGTGGGKGTGVGTGTGGSKGPGNRAPLSERQQRVLRWNMVFDTRSGDDYRLQLQSLQAIVAIPDGPPDADGQQKYLVFRDLRRGAKPAPEDLRAIQRIFWVDNRPESVSNLARSLDLKEVPSHIVAFFPPELEDKLAKQEEAFARSRGQGRNIKETRFRIVFNGRTGKYEPILVDQR